MHQEQEGVEDLAPPVFAVAAHRLFEVADHPVPDQRHVAMMHRLRWAGHLRIQQIDQLHQRFGCRRRVGVIPVLQHIEQGRDHIVVVRPDRGGAGVDAQLGVVPQDRLPHGLRHMEMMTADDILRAFVGEVQPPQDLAMARQAARLRIAAKASSRIDTLGESSAGMRTQMAASFSVSLSNRNVVFRPSLTPCNSSS